MAFPWGLVLAGAILWGLMQATPPKPSAHSSESPDTPQLHLDPQPIFDDGTDAEFAQEQRITYPALGTNDITEKDMFDLNETSPTLYSRIEELQSNITAMEADVKAKHLFIDAVMQHLNAWRRENDPGSIDAYTVLTDALRKVPEASQKFLIDYLNFSDVFGNRTGDETEIPSDDDTVTGVTGAPLYSSTQDDQEGDIRKSLKVIESVLLAANNSLPIGLQRNDSLTLTIHIIRLTLTNRIPLTFHDIKPIFVALSKSSHSISEYFTSRSDPPRDRYGNVLYNTPTPKVQTEKLDFAAIAMKDVLKVLCDIAVKLNTRGLLLKSYFEFNLGEKRNFVNALGAQCENTRYTHFSSRHISMDCISHYCPILLLRKETIKMHSIRCFASGVCGGIGFGGPCMGGGIPPIPPPPCAGGIGMGCGAGYTCGAYGCYRSRARVHGAGTVHNGLVSMGASRISQFRRPEMTRDPNVLFMDCCEQRGLPDACLRHCTYNTFRKDTLIRMYFKQDACPVQATAEIQFCAAQGRDHRACCERNGVTTTLAGVKCLTFCDQRPGNVTMLDMSYVPCYERFENMKACFWHDTVNRLKK
ncbi:hypothetical protein GCK32_005863 [Trichostrongylus colubriformis]|uniref:Domain of unknown function DB domain-containing protein n=1 Tax=Trichostrongylus colubriformis TaxID=6319 RepID=A0AAN8IYB0_TRICO